jgi:lipopolysaccharide biosynthesis glycosyltransferase
MMRTSINIVFIVDENYVPALAVALQSLVEAHYERRTNKEDYSIVNIKIYVIHNGISTRHLECLYQIVAQYSTYVSIQDIPIDPIQLAPPHLYPSKKLRENWATWGKLWLDKLLPVDVNHVLYLDCDIIVQRSLLSAWQTLLSQSSVVLFAVTDFGFSTGHEHLSVFGWNMKPTAHNTATKTTYFNAGFMGLNLKEWRRLMFGSCLRAFAREFADHSHLHYADQDVLNLIFQGHWEPLPYVYNVQGMGTYADCRQTSSSSQEKPMPPMSLYTPTEWEEIQANAVIIHFTGKVKPSVTDFLNPYAKMPTKPWTWFCHHPCAPLFQALLSRTLFANTLNTTENSYIIKELEESLTQDIDKLVKKLKPTKSVISIYLMQKVLLQILQKSSST